MFGNYSKFIGSLVGGVIGLAASRYGMPAELATPEIQGALTILLGAVATFVFPANKKPV